MKRLIVGLGNPGGEYVNTRHNIGFMLVDLLAQNWGFSEWKKRNHAKISKGERDGNEIVLVKPQTYMNLSGTAVLSLMTSLKIPPGNLLVIVDDFALPFGKIRIRSGGSDGGHNGLASIIEKIGRNDFARLRIGIGSPPEYMDCADYVLSKFNSEEKKLLPEILENSGKSVETIINEGINTAMNKFN